MRKKAILLVGTLLALCSPLPAIVISEIMYHPPQLETKYEYVEIYNETVARRDLSGWYFDEGIVYTFPPGTTLDSKSYLVIAIDPSTIMTSYGITNVVGPFTSGRLDNDSDHVTLRDAAGGRIAEVDYSDQGKWPTAADGTGHSLSKYIMRGDPMDPDNWRASVEVGGTPGKDNGFQPWFEDVILMDVGEQWRYFKGTTEASNPVTAWRQIVFNDVGWLQGATGIGYGDGDDTTVLIDMQNNYLSVFFRKTLTFTAADIAAMDSLILEIDHDDGFTAYLNGSFVGDSNMPNGTAFNAQASLHEASGGNSNPQPPTQINLTPFKSSLQVGDNVLAVQVHNANLGSSDLSFIPRLLSRTYHDPGQASLPVVINEVRFNTSGTQYIELYNTSAAPIDVGDYCLSNNPDNLGLFRIPSPTVIPGNSHVAFLQSQLGFSMTASGDRILFTSPGLTSVIDARAVEPGPLNMTEGRWPDGADDWYYMDPTTGTANAVNLQSAVVINEIMYNPPTDNDRDEYIEIYNTGATAVDLTGWRFSRGIQYRFTTGVTTINPGQYLVIASDRDRLIARYGLDPAIVLGNFTGRLGNAGEKIRLRDANNNVADEVPYYEGGHWSKWADGYGSSLELIDPRQDNANYQAWAPSDERSKAQWTFFSYSGNPSIAGDVNEHEVHLHLMGPGRVLIDDFRMRIGSTDYIPNGDFELGVGQWVINGNHVQSHVTTDDAHGGSRSLRIVATGRGDTGANHIEQDASIPMPGGQTYTMSFWAKWEWGNPVLITRVYNNQMPETHMIPTPQLTGTPGAQNTAYRANLGPVFSEVLHSPAIPAPAATVHVTARCYDPDGVATANLYYKADADPAFASTPLFDDGAHNDGAAGDGLYGGDIPARPAGQTVAFYLQGTDGLGAANTWPTDSSNAALYRVENSTVSSNFPIHRIIMTQADANELYNRDHLSNEQLNCTFVFNEQDVYYNCGVRYIGSPFHRLGTGYTGYKVAFNADQKLHGVKSQTRMDNQGGATPYHDRVSYDLQRRMGLPSCQLEWVYLRFNGSNDGVREDTLPPSVRRYLDIFYRGDDDGYVFEIDDRFWYSGDDDYNIDGRGSANADFVWRGPDKDIYRHNFEVRNHDDEDDYTSVILMLNVMNNTPPNFYDEAIAAVINVEQWFTLFAVRAAISDWDFIAFRRGKNCYIYWPSNRGKWDLLGWDSELTFGDTGMSIWSNFGAVRTFQQRGRHLHFYYHYIKMLLDKYFTRAQLDPWLDHYASLVGGNPGNEKNFIDGRRAYLLGLIPAAVCNITTNNGNPFTTTLSNVTLRGTAPVEVRWVRVGGIDYYLDWTGATNWFIDLPLRPGVNVIDMQFLNYDKVLMCTDSITITADLPGMEVEKWPQY